MNESWQHRRKNLLNGHGTNGGIEVSSDGLTVSMRDSKDPGGPVLRFNSAAWKDFLDAVKRDEFDPGDD